MIGDTDSWCGTRDSRYVYDLNRMVRFDARTGKTQTIIIEILWASRRMKTIMSHDKSLGVRRSVSATNVLKAFIVYLELYVPS